MHKLLANRSLILRLVLEELEDLAPPFGNSPYLDCLTSHPYIFLSSIFLSFQLPWLLAPGSWLLPLATLVPRHTATAPPAIDRLGSGTINSGSNSIR